MEKVRNWYWEKKAMKAVQALKKNEFDAEYFPTTAESVSKVMEIAASAKTIGVGGSVTVRELNILDALEAKDRTRPFTIIGSLSCLYKSPCAFEDHN